MSKSVFLSQLFMFYSLSAAFLLLVSCTSISHIQNKKPPQTLLLLSSEDRERIDLRSIEAYLKKFAQTNKDISSQWWAKYQTAKLLETTNPEKSCFVFTQLAEETSFPLHKVAFLKKKTVCRVHEKDLKQIKDILENKDEKWLHHLAAEVGSKQAEYLSSSPYLAYFQYKLSFHTLVPSEQIELLEKSISSAQQASDKKQEDLSLKRLYKIAPRFKPSQDVSPFKLAYDYRKARQFDKASQIYQTIIKDPKSSPYDVYKALKRLRIVSKLANNKGDVLKYSAQLETMTKKQFVKIKNQHAHQRLCRSNTTRLYHNGALLYAKTLWTQNQRSKAQKVLETVQDHLKNCNVLQNIYWVLTQMEEEARDFNKAMVWAKKGIQIALPESQIWEKLKWRLAWNLRKTSQFSESILHLKEITAITQENFLRAKYRYWTARNYEDMNDHLQAQMEFQNLTQTDPLGYYGLLAYRSLKKPIPAFHDISKDSTTQRLIASKQRLSSPIDENLIKWLIAVNEKTLAKNYLRTQKSKILRQVNMENVINYLSIVGDHIQVFSYLAQSSFSFKNHIISTFPHLFFPTPYLQQITDLSNKYAVPKELIYSIIRQESAFNEYARSPADAFGLMQLLPRVAKQTSEVSQLPYQSEEDLYNPKTNLSLGVFHLRQLLDKFNNQFIMTVASYNAPEDAVRNWVKERFHNSPIEFIEDIPYRETKLYVKLVLRNLIFYQRLFSNKDIPFPEWCLDGLQSFKPKSYQQASLLKDSKAH